jgi:murein DD-endopeptidase MepM/ murein hydrolase activator NlpD
MNPTQRILAFGLLVVFGATLFGRLADPNRERMETVTASILPAAFANPAEVVHMDTLRSGETITQLLMRARLADDEARGLVSALSGHQDPRRLRPGAVVSYRTSYLEGKVRGMELRLDADRTLNLRREGDDWAGQVEEVPVVLDTVVLTGMVETSLYAALLRGEGDDIPAEERERVADILAERIFAWQIDFSRDLRRGDTYRVLYERAVRPDGTARWGKVLGVEFQVNGRENTAFLHRAHDGTEEYYARDGESLKRAFLRAPLEFRRISSAFSRSRFHPVLGVNRPHNGIDYAAAPGTPIRAVGDGTVTRAGWGGGYGNLVDIRHSRGYTTRYAHLRGFAQGVRAGGRVRQGDIIGYVGSTGLATGPHLHFEFHLNGRPIDPNSVRDVTGEPLPPRSRAAFVAQVERYAAMMDVLEGRTRLAGRVPAAVAPEPLR